MGRMHARSKNKAPNKIVQRTNIRFYYTYIRNNVNVFVCTLYGFVICASCMVLLYVKGHKKLAILSGMRVEFSERFVSES